MGIKKIALGMPQDSYIYKVMVDRLDSMGYEVLLLTSEEEFKYKNIRERSISFYRKTFLKDREYKKELKKNFYNEKSLSVIQELEPNSVLSLIIRPDIFDFELLQNLKLKSAKMIAYQWDGLDRFKNVLDYISLFDKFYVFDKSDVDKYKEYKLYPTNNFYFDGLNLTQDIKRKSVPKAYFIGHFDDRVKDIVKISDILIKLKLDVEIILGGSYHSKKDYLKKSYINKPKKIITYADNLSKAYNSDILLDFHNPIHHGLSFRPFEALGFNKKLITNNELIKEYDFYHPNNIFVWNNQNLGEIEEFLKKPYVLIESGIKEKYSFTYWLNHVFSNTSKN